MQTNTGHLTDADYFPRYEAACDLYNAEVIGDEQFDTLTDLLDEADAYGQLDNLRIVDGLLVLYTS